MKKVKMIWLLACVLAVGGTAYAADLGVIHMPACAIDDRRPPEHFCPITLAVMQDPVVAADGHSYERKDIAAWLLSSVLSPATGAPLRNKDLFDNHTLKTIIREWNPGIQGAPSALETREAERKHTKKSEEKEIAPRGPEIPPIARGYEEIYRRFFQGVLIYRPTEKSDAGLVVMPIAELRNPLKGTFDLSRCGDTGQYLSISTGYRQGMKAENASKLEIWFAPKFLIEQELATTANHFNGIKDQWNATAHVGIFWTWGGSDNLSLYDYLIKQSFDSLSSESLYQKWQASRTWGTLTQRLVAVAYPEQGTGSVKGTAAAKNFMFIL